MTTEEMVKLFEKHSGEFLKFDAIENKRSNRPDLHAFILLDSILPGTGDMIECSEHDEIMLSIDCDKLLKVITEDQIIELYRCGVRYNSEYNSLTMYTQKDEMNTVQNGKGSKPRQNFDLKKFEDGWDAVFGMKKFYITFGFNQGHDNCYVIVNAKNETEARKKMISEYGRKWGFLYDSPDAAGVDRFNLHKLTEI